MSITNIVVSRYKKNVDWIYKIENNVKFFIYDKENSENTLNIPVNKGHEASVYLKYIIDNYYTLSDYTFFIHDEEYAWHHSDSIIKKYYEALASGEMYYNINDLCILGSIITNIWYGDILKWYKLYIDPYIPLDSIPVDWTNGHRGSAQFLVHKERIHRLPLKFYKDLYNWIITTPLPDAQSGRYLEWAWHLFWA